MTIRTIRTARAASTFVMAALLGLGALPAGARDLSGEFSVSPAAPGDGYLPAAAMDARGEVIVAWAQGGDGILARRFGRDGTPRGDGFQVGEQGRSYLGPIEAALDTQGFSVVWGESSNHSGSASFLRRFGPAGGPLTGAISLSADFSVGSPSVGTDGRGNSVAVWPNQTGRVLGRRFDAQGRPAGPAFEVTPGPSFNVKVAVAGNGSFVAVWMDARGGGGGAYGRRFDAAAKPLGSVFLVAATASNIALAGNAQGAFAASWTSSRGIQARASGPAGLRNAVLVTSQKPASRSSIAMDAAGRFLVTWTCCQDIRPATTFGRFFNASGAPLDRSFPISLRNGTMDTQPSAAAGPAGDFLVVWQQLSETEGGGIVGRFLDWSPRGADPCLAGAGSLACDVSRDGGTPEITAPLGLRRGDVPLLGDLDDDRRDDPCRFRDGRFLCDTAHDGSPDLDIAFGQPGDAPLLGDIDGEGRADPCVRRGAQILCDTAHNGGTAEVVVTFGAAGSPILLGDVDGDGDDDPCLPGGGRLSCDTEHDGGAAELQIPLATQAGDVP
ncbi:MAG TPA: hypothetical protein VKK31_18375, partial [Thermoanaerobaculia bacterium]|nr:hypothetical protein [Thermoanaerobaculia bacterium]